MSHGKISGIYNYCDRWCERCTFTSRCAIYENEGETSPEELDMKNEAFWKRLGENFQKARDLLQKAAEHSGVDLKAIEEEAKETENRKQRIKIESQEHPLSKLSQEYGELARQWLKTQPGMLDRLDTLKTGLTLGVESHEGAKRETNMIRGSLAVIQWYLAFIHVKLMRALMGKLNDDGWEEKNGFQRDFDGSAKIALIAIHRSIHAWSALFEILPENEDAFLKILSLLDKIKKTTKEEFPKAEVFIRPGFDED